VWWPPSCLREALALRIFFGFSLQARPGPARPAQRLDRSDRTAKMADVAPSAAAAAAAARGAATAAAAACGGVGKPQSPARRIRWALAAAAVAVLLQLRAHASAAPRFNAAPPPPKPAHCRTDLPGCVPRRADFLYLLHVPKARRRAELCPRTGPARCSASSPPFAPPPQAAGSSVQAFLAAGAADRHNNGFAPHECPLAETGGFEEYHCYGLRAWHLNATHASRICRAQRRALRAPAARDWFGALGCNTLAGHYDMGVFTALDEAVRAHARRRDAPRAARPRAEPLLLPAARAGDPGAHGRGARAPGRAATGRGNLWSPSLCTKNIYTNPLLTARPAPQPVSVSLEEFVRGEAGLGIDLEAGATKMLAGDYCCFHDRPAFTRGEDRLRAAAEALDAQVGAVVVKERMQESLEVRAAPTSWLARACAKRRPWVLRVMRTRPRAALSPPAPPPARSTSPFCWAGRRRRLARTCETPTRTRARCRPRSCRASTRSWRRTARSTPAGSPSWTASWRRSRGGAAGPSRPRATGRSGRRRPRCGAAGADDRPPRAWPRRSSRAGASPGGTTVLVLQFTAM
jgi:hypothetical protein